MNHFGQTFFFIGCYFLDFLDGFKEDVPKHQNIANFHKLKHLWFQTFVIDMSYDIRTPYKKLTSICQEILQMTV